MKKVSLFLALLVLASLLLAACGEQPTATSVPSTNVPMETSTSAMPATEAPTSTAEAATSTSEANSVSTPAIPVTGGNQPSQRITNLIGSAVCGMAGDQLGTIKDLVLDFNQSVVTYMIVDANGRSVAIPYSFLIKPRSGGAGTGSGTGTGPGTGNSASASSTPAAGGTGTLATDTPSAGGTGTLATSTPSTGAAVSTATSTTGTGSGTGTGNSGTGANAQQNCLTLSAANDVFTKAPAFDKSIMPGIGQSAQDWDTDIMDWWVTSGAPPATSTPAAGGSADTAPTATVAPGVQQMQGVILASDLLDANIALSSQGAGSGTGTGTGSSLSTSTPSAGGSSTAMPDTTATASSGGTGSGTGTGLGTGSTGGSQGKIEDVIIEPRIGKLQYVVVSTGADTWILVPISALGWDAINNQAGLMVDASMLQNAPSFSSSQFPDISTPGWSQQFSTYWSGGAGTGSAVATATP